MKRSIVIAIILLMVSPLVTLSAKPNAAKVKLIYFHATSRCESCLKIEKFTEMAVNELYANELKSGKLEFSSLDFMEEKNEKLAKKYSIDSQNLILSVITKGKEKKWINLEAIWDKIASYEEFKSYIKDNISKYIK